MRWRSATMDATELSVLLADWRQVLWDLRHPENWRRHYQVWTIPKKDGRRRRLHAPRGRLKELQRALLPWLNRFPLSPAAKAFLPGGPSHLEVALGHLRHAGPQGCLFAADLKDFFGYVTADHLRRAGLPEDVIVALTVPHRRRGRVLPQGAPTSPCASNLAAREFDQAVLDALPPGVLYTRWADDLGFSAPFSLSFREMLRLVDSLARKFGFVLAREKCRLMTPASGRSYLGVTLQDGLRPSRRFRRKLRAALYNCRRGRDNRQSLEGLQAYLKQVELCRTT